MIDQQARQPSAREVTAIAMAMLGLGPRRQPQAYLLREAAHFGSVGRRLSPRNQQRLHRLRSAAAAVWRTIWRWL
jgi:hypothetical protein